MTKISLMKIPLVVAVLSAVLLPKETRAAATPETQLPQRITLTAKDIPLTQMFEKIEMVSDYIFVYQEDVSSDKTKVSIDVKDADIRDVLVKILPKDVNYRLSGRQILLHKSDAAATLNKPETASQNLQKPFTVKGKVTDSTGEPVVGAYVMPKGTRDGVIADIDGNWSIDVKTPDVVLVFSALSYATQEVAVNGRATINVTMQNEINRLDEVVVIGYGTQTKATVTGALSVVDTKKFVEAPVSSISNVLAGAVPGVSTVQTSGQPGKDAASIYIRGTGSLSTELSKPLVLVDGVEREFSQIDPNEIENMSVLKDAASTAVFGVRGANGVILITTRRGKEGRMSISVSSNT